MSVLVSRLTLLALVVAIVFGCVLQYRMSGPPVYASFRAREPSKFRRDAALLEASPPLRSKTCVVTGAAGFLASHLVEQLLLQSWTVHALVRNGTDTTLLESFPRANGQLHVVHGDITDYASLQRAVPQDVAVVFHVAALVTPWFGANDNMYRVNVLGTRKVVDVCLEKNVQKLVHTSSTSVFAGPNRDFSQIVDELTPHYGVTSWNGYENTKALAEVEVRAAIEDGLWATIMNPGGILGPYDVSGFARVGRMLQRNELPAIPNCVCSFGSAKEIALAHIAAAERGRLGRNYILSGPATSYKDLISAAIDVVIPGSALPPVLPTFVLVAVGLVNDFISLFTGKVPDLSLEVAIVTSRDELSTSERAVRELGFNASVQPAKLVTDSMLWLKQTKRL